MVNKDIILNKQTDTERYILQAEGKTDSKEVAQNIKYSISEQELRMFSTRQRTKKISYMPEI
jgi:hypothetical protein